MPNIILIKSVSEDVTTSKVMCWLESSKVIRHNNDTLTDFDIDLGSDRISLFNSVFQSNQFSFWHRRGFYRLSIPDLKVNWFNRFIAGEYRTVNEFLLFFLSRFAVNSLGAYVSEARNNKLINLVRAKTCGLSIPGSGLNLVSKSDSNRYITKPVANFFSEKLGDIHILIGNSLIRKEDDFRAGANSFIQEYVEKLYELRIFYLKGVFFSMAIFSQSDEQTRLDYRNYNRQRPNRNVPYTLPKAVEHKLRMFMESSELDTGSIDMIVTPKGEYVFLEVNPVGQFDWLSVNCNYYIDRQIAKYLEYGEIPPSSD